MRLLTPLAFFALASLASGQKDRVATGDWGGEHARLSVTKDGATIEFDCARGDLEAMLLDREGRFDVKGRLVPEHMGPTLKDAVDKSQPARYKGSVEGDTLTLEVVPESGESMGPFHLTRGGRAHLMKCRAGAIMSPIEIPPDLVGQWALVAGRIDGGDFALGRAGATKIFGEWAISPQRVQNSWGALGVQKLDQQGRITLLTTAGLPLQYLFFPSSSEPRRLLAIAYLKGKERLRGLLVPQQDPAIQADHDWLAELRAREADARSQLEAASRETPFVLEGQGQRLVFEEPKNE